MRRHSRIRGSSLFRSKCRQRCFRWRLRWGREQQQPGIGRTGTYNLNFLLTIIEGILSNCFRGEREAKCRRSGSSGCGGFYVFCPFAAGPFSKPKRTKTRPQVDGHGVSKDAYVIGWLGAILEPTKPGKPDGLATKVPTFAGDEAKQPTQP
jgi:hypothetical protein